MGLLWVVSKTQSQSQAYLFSKECCFGVRFRVLQKKKIDRDPGPSPGPICSHLSKAHSDLVI